MSVLILLLFASAIAVVLIFKNPDEEYTQEEIADKIAELRREIAWVDSERNTHELSTYEYYVAKQRIMNEIAEMEEKVMP